MPLAVKLVTEQGRMKFVRPIYRDLYAWEEQRKVNIIFTVYYVGWRYICEKYDSTFKFILKGHY